MPKKPLKKLRSIKAAQVDDLLYGPDLFTYVNPPPPVFKDERQRRKSWESYREELLPIWVNDKPGTRPEIWWELDAPEPRRVLGQGVYWDTKGKMVVHDVTESEPEYLERLDLWLPEERGRAKDYLALMQETNERVVHNGKKAIENAQNGVDLDLYQDETT